MGRPRPPPRDRRPRASTRAGAHRRPARRRPTSSATIRGTSSRAAAGKVRVRSPVSTSTPRGRASWEGAPAATTRSAQQDRHPVAHQLNLAQQMGAQQHGATPRRRSSASRSRTIRRPTGSSALVGSSSSSRRGEPRRPVRFRGAAPQPFDIASTTRRGHPRARRARATASARPRRPATPPGADAARAARRRLAIRGNETAPPGTRRPRGRAGSRPASLPRPLARPWRAPARKRSWPGSTCRRRWDRAGPAARPAPPAGRPRQREGRSVALLESLAGEGGRHCCQCRKAPGTAI